MVFRTFLSARKVSRSSAPGKVYPKTGQFLCFQIGRLSSISDSVCVSWGGAHYGALGIPVMEDQYEPVVIGGLTKISAVGAGDYHSMAISDGQLWTWGRNQEYQLGRAVETEQAVVPGPVESLSKHNIIKAAGSGVATFAITDNGSLFSFGTSRRGQLGIGEGIEMTQEPRKIDIPGCCTHISLGWGHAVALNSDGEVFTWGWCANGRLAHSFASSAEDELEENLQKRSIWSPRKVKLLEDVKVTHVAAGGDHTLIVSECGNLYSFGDGDLGQLGRPIRQEGEHMEPTGIDDCQVKICNTLREEKGAENSFSRVAAGLGHNIALMRDGNIRTWGWNLAGQCGLGKTEGAIVSYPTLLDIPSSIEAIFEAGRVHTILATRSVGSDAAKKFLLSFGSATNGRLGTGSNIDSLLPEEIELPVKGDIIDIACGMDHNVAIVTPL